MTGLALISFRMQSVGLFGDRGLYPLSTSLQTIKKFIAERETSDIFSTEYAMRAILSLVYEKFHAKRDLSAKLRANLRYDLAACLVGVVWPHPVVFVYLYLAYYSYKRISGPFLNFQWDSLLLESLFVSVPLALSSAPWMDALCVWLFRFLLFRLMFGSGMVKAFGRDPAWHTNFSAMRYHFQTQPLPNRLARLVHLHAPPAAFAALTYATLAVEVLFPLLSLASWPLCNVVVAAGYAGLMLAIGSTGHFGFFNALTTTLSVALLSDETLLSCVRPWAGDVGTSGRGGSAFGTPLQRALDFAFPQTYLSQRRGQTHDPFDGHTAWGALGQLVGIFLNAPLILGLSLAFVLALLRLLQRCRLFAVDAADADAADGRAKATDAAGAQRSSSAATDASPTDEDWLVRVYRRSEAFLDYAMTVAYVGNHYGLFATMTTQRDEVRVEVAVNPQPGRSFDPRRQGLSTGAAAGRDEASTAAAAADSAALQWQPVRFRYKPDDVDAPPATVWPFFHIPRLDWCMWFVALKPSVRAYPTWFWHLLLCLLEHDEDVLRLLHPATTTMLRGLRAQLQQSPPSVASASDADGEDRQIDGLLLRVSLWRYTFASPDAVEADDGAPPLVEVRRGRAWTAVKLREVLAPTNRNNLLRIFEQSSARAPTSASPRPTVETAQEIILRTLFRNVQLRRRHRPSNENSGDAADVIVDDGEPDRER